MQGPTPAYEPCVGDKARYCQVHPKQFCDEMCFVAKGEIAGKHGPDDTVMEKMILAALESNEEEKHPHDDFEDCYHLYHGT